MNQISKVGDWKTIDQRERTQTRDRKVMRRAAAGVAAGAGLAGLGLSRGGGPGAQNLARAPRAMYRTGRALGNSRGGAALGAAKVVGGQAVRNPNAAAIVGGAGLAAGSAALGTGAKGQHTYQQHKINQRRRANAKAKQLRKSSVSAFGIEH